MNSWQPIETAPRDGTRILAYDAEYPLLDNDHIGEAMEVIRWVDWANYWRHAGEEYSFDPTHWMPLPEPPK